MSLMCSAAGITGLVLLSPLFIYVAARMIFTAYFFTREQFNRRTTNGTR